MAGWSTRVNPSRIAYVGLGANLGDREATLREAVRRLGNVGQVTAVSSLYETDPVGYLKQPPFLNAIVILETALSAPYLMKALLAIEHALGRTRTFPNAPRTLDLDLLFLGDEVTQSPDITVPHPRLRDRAFVLIPLAEVAPGVLHPALRQSIAKLCEALPAETGVRLYAPSGWQITPPEDADMSRDR